MVGISDERVRNCNLILLEFANREVDEETAPKQGVVFFVVHENIHEEVVADKDGEQILHVYSAESNDLSYNRSHWSSTNMYYEFAAL